MRKLKNQTLHLLRYSMAFIYVWFGLLKIFNISPVGKLVFHSTYWISFKFSCILGIWEVLTGLFLFCKKLQRIGLLLFFLQIPGTFLPLFLNPQECFTVFPYGLTLEGEFIIKNLVLIAAGLVLWDFSKQEGKE